MSKIKAFGEFIILIFVLYIICQWVSIPWKIDEKNDLLGGIKEELKKRNDLIKEELNKKIIKISL